MRDLYQRHERPLSAKDGITGEKWPVNFACDFDFHVNPGFFDMPRKSATWETALLPPQGRHAVDFFARKIRRLRPGSNPRSWVPEASMLTTRPPKPLHYMLWNSKFDYRFTGENVSTSATTYVSNPSPHTCLYHLLAVFLSYVFIFLRSLFQGATALSGSGAPHY